MARRRFLRLILVALACACGSSTYASEASPRSKMADRLNPSSAGTGVDAGDPLRDLRRASVTLEEASRRRVPDWSPEAEVVKGRVDAILAGMLDYEAIARRALGTEWDTLTSAQRRLFLEKFSALTNQAFVSFLARPELHLRFDSETVSGEAASVLVTGWASKSASDGGQHLEYRLARKRDHWLVCDVLVDQISLVDGYRDQFARLMRRGGFSEIIQRMEHKLEVAGRR